MVAIADIPTVSQAIRDAVAPVFLITGVGSILGVLTNRLGRAVDRYRKLNELKPEAMSDASIREMQTIIQRIRWIRRAVGLCTFSILCICLTVASFFVAVEFGIDFSMMVSSLFILTMFSLVCGLLCFLREISLATQETIDIPARLDKPKSG
jgi:hypothetical protein